MNLWIPPFLTKAPFGSILSARIGQAAFGQAREGVRNGFRGGKCGACLEHRCFIGLQVGAGVPLTTLWPRRKSFSAGRGNTAPADPAKVQVGDARRIGLAPSASIKSARGMITNQGGVANGKLPRKEKVSGNM